METKQIHVIINHYQENWGNNYERRILLKSPMLTLSNEFCVLEYKPNNENRMWIYATCGMSMFNRVNPIELHLFSSKQDSGLVELLTAIAYYHMTGTTLNVNHTVNFGIPWQAESECTFGLISLPYLDGPKLENLITTNGVIHFYWLIPITIKEKDYAKENGIEALEQKFEEHHLDYLDPNRESVV